MCLPWANGGDIVFAGSLQNSGTGDFAITSGSTVTIGGDGAAGNAAVGSAGGTTTISGANVALEADNGYAQLGFHGGGAAGDIVVNATGDVTLTAVDSFAQIGHGGSGVAGSNSGDISVTAGGNVMLASGNTSFGKYAQIGNGGDNTDSTNAETGDITVSAVDIDLALVRRLHADRQWRRRLPPATTHRQHHPERHRQTCP